MFSKLKIATLTILSTLPVAVTHAHTGHAMDATPVGHALFHGTEYSIIFAVVILAFATWHFMRR